MPHCVTCIKKREKKEREEKEEEREESCRQKQIRAKETAREKKTMTAKTASAGPGQRARLALNIFTGFIIILACLYAGRLAAACLPFVFPGNIIGLFILFLLLQLRIIPVARIMDAGALMMFGMPLFYIPAATGIMDYLNELWSSLPAIIIAVLSGVALIILGTGGVFQWLAEGPEGRARRKTAYRRARNIKRPARLRKLSPEAPHETLDGQTAAPEGARNERF